MDKKAVAECLRALASDEKNRSKAARLRDVIDDVEAAFVAGVSRSAVVEELAKNGLAMSLTTFETTLRRIRQQYERPSLAHATPPERAARSVKPQEAAKDQATPPQAEEPAQEASHNPVDIDRIIGNAPDLDSLAKLAKRKKT